MAEKSYKKLSIIIPCYNEKNSISEIINRVKNVVIPLEKEIIIVDDFSTDGTREIIKNNYAVSDTRFIIDYYRFTEDWRMLFGGGETYTSKFLINSKNFVRERMYKVFPELKKFKIEYSWGGTLAITVNRLPSFGSLMNNKVIYAHGYSGHGLALSILAGKLIYEKIAGRPERFNFIKDIKNISIPGGDVLRRPIYTSAVAYYKLVDIFKSINRWSSN